MSRVARWRRAPNEPTTVRGWLSHGGLQTLPPSQGVPNRDPQRGRWLAFGLLAYLLVGASVLLLFPKGGKFLPMMNLPIVVGNAVAAYRRKPKTVENGEPGDSLWVVASIQDARGNPTGRDAGWLISSEGWLLFEGGRTSFAFTRGEARPSRADSAQIFLEDGRRVLFAPTGDRPDFSALRHLVDDWSFRPTPEGEALLPPAEPHPARWVDCHTGWIFGAVAFGVIAVFGFVFGVYWTGLTSALGVAVCVGHSARCVFRLKEELPILLEPMSSYLPSSRECL